MIIKRITMPITLSNVLGFIPTNLWSSLKKFIKTDRTVVYDVPFQLVTKYTPALLIVMMCLSLANQFVRNVEIDCITRDMEGQRGVGGDPELNDYCWNYETFLVANALKPNVRGIVTYPGISGYKKDVDELIRIRYYKQVWHILGKLAVFAYTPLFLWKFRGKECVRYLVDVKPFERMTPDDIRVSKFIEQAGSNGDFAYQYLFCKLFAVCIPIAHWYYLCGFVGHLYVYYGIDVVANFMDPSDPWPNPMDALFPKIAKCEVAKYGYSGDIEIRAAQCQLPMNNLTQWSFFIYWWWLVFIFLINCLSCARMGLMVIPYFRNSQYRSFVAVVCRDDVETARSNPIHLAQGEVMSKRLRKSEVIIAKLTLSDWLVLNFVQKNLQGWQFRNFIRRLAVTKNHFLQLQVRNLSAALSLTQVNNSYFTTNGPGGERDAKFGRDQAAELNQIGFKSAVLGGQVVNPPLTQTTRNAKDKFEVSLLNSLQLPISREMESLALQVNDGNFAAIGPGHGKEMKLGTNQAKRTKNGFTSAVLLGRVLNPLSPYSGKANDILEFCPAHLLRLQISSGSEIQI